MTPSATFLHITDPHIAESGIEFPRDDFKADIPEIENDTREEVLTLLLQRLAERLRKEGRQLDGVLFSGDAQNRGLPGGHELLLRLLTEHLGPFGITNNRIVATPGNHDVPLGSPPSSAQRYAGFKQVWDAAGCIVPWLDGAEDGAAKIQPERHRLVAIDCAWTVYPINTSNWSHTSVTLPDPLKSVWDALPELAAGGDTAKQGQLRKQLEELARFDMARVSKAQLEVLRAVAAGTPTPASGRQLRIAVMHHHLRSPSLREELKPFADISNIEQVRAFFAGSQIGIVIHGHKHEHAAQFDHVYDEQGNEVHRALVLSGATFEVGREADAARLVTIHGLPHTPEIEIEPLALPRAGAELAQGRPLLTRIWTKSGGTSGSPTPRPNSPVMVEGSDLDEVYARACAMASSDAQRGTLIVHLDLPDDDSESLPIPTDYQWPTDLGEGDRSAWLRDLVDWWQLDRSQLTHRIPYHHGVRLRRFGGKIDQIGRVIKLLRAEASTRALAVLVDPFLDFTKDGRGEEFASFCLVEFRRRDATAGRIVIDAIAFYRAQEFRKWWPVNVAELRFLQREICEALGYRPGRITTIAADARTISKSPTQVAMPIIDRWLDQAPERLHLLAGALVRKHVQGAAQRKVILEWRRSLNEMRAAAEEFNPDGVPVAVEGLRALHSFLVAAHVEDDPELGSFARRVSDLANLNESFEGTTGSRSAFKRWSPVALSHIDELETVTDQRMKEGVD